MDAVKQTVKSFLLEEFLPGEDPAALGDSTPLITGGILDSISTLRLVAFLEKSYGIKFQAHEVSANHLDTLELIAATVAAKR
ncbi:MAG: acyl carrier protein [Gemmatimonadetes bacterium]|nr:acyl carrier protein [Gemmatimonadota bacterium]